MTGQFFDRPDFRTEAWKRKVTVIVQLRRNMTSTMASLIDKIDELSNGNADADFASRLSHDSGLSMEEIKTFSAFGSLLESSRRPILRNGVSFTTARALLAAEEPVRKEALRMIGEPDADPLNEDSLRDIGPRIGIAGLSPEEAFHRSRLLSLTKQANGTIPTMIERLATTARDLAEDYEIYLTTYVHLRLNGWERDEFDEVAISEGEAELSAKGKTLKTQFADIFGDSHPEPKDWKKDPHDSCSNAIAAAWKAINYLANKKLGWNSPVGSLDGFEFIRDSLAYLSGDFQKLHQKSRVPWPRQKLRMVGLNAGIGSEAIGLMASGYDPVVLLESSAANVAVIDQNWPRWNVQHAQVIDATSAAMIEKDIDLVSAGLLDERNDAWNAGIVDAIDVIAPKSFILEVPDQFTVKRQKALTNRLLELSGGKYHVHQLPLSIADYGLPQLGVRNVIIGIAKEFSEAFRPPVLKCPLKRSLRDLRSVLLPERLDERPSDVELAERTRYRNTKDVWLETFGDNLAPKLTPWSDTPPEARLEEWKFAGFKFSSLLSDHHIPKGKEGLLSITIAALKSLHGIPLRWRLDGLPIVSQTRLLASGMPPLMAKAIGICVRSALTGDPVDLVEALNEPIINREQIGRPISSLERSLMLMKGHEFDFEDECGRPVNDPEELFPKVSTARPSPPIVYRRPVQRPDPAPPLVWPA